MPRCALLRAWETMARQGSPGVFPTKFAPGAVTLQLDVIGREVALQAAENMLRYLERWWLLSVFPWQEAKKPRLEPLLGSRHLDQTTEQKTTSGDPS